MVGVSGKVEVGAVKLDVTAKLDAPAQAATAPLLQTLVAPLGLVAGQQTSGGMTALLPPGAKKSEGAPTAPGVSGIGASNVTMTVAGTDDRFGGKYTMRMEKDNTITIFDVHAYEGMTAGLSPSDAMRCAFFALAATVYGIDAKQAETLCKPGGSLHDTCEKFVKGDTVKGMPAKVAVTASGTGPEVKAAPSLDLSKPLAGQVTAKAGFDPGKADATGLGKTVPSSAGSVSFQPSKEAAAKGRDGMVDFLVAAYPGMTKEMAGRYVDDKVHHPEMAAALADWQAGKPITLKAQLVPRDPALLAMGGGEFVLGSGGKPSSYLVQADPSKPPLSVDIPDGPSPMQFRYHPESKTLDVKYANGKIVPLKLKGAEAEPPAASVPPAQTWLAANGPEPKSFKDYTSVRASLVDKRAAVAKAGGGEAQLKAIDAQIAKLDDAARIFQVTSQTVPGAEVTEKALKAETEKAKKLAAAPAAPTPAAVPEPSGIPKAKKSFHMEASFDITHHGTIGADTKSGMKTGEKYSAKASYGVVASTDTTVTFKISHTGKSGKEWSGPELNTAFYQFMANRYGLSTQQINELMGSPPPGNKAIQKAHQDFTHAVKNGTPVTFPLSVEVTEKPKQSPPKKSK